MKKILFAALACLAFFGCQEEGPVAPEKVDKIQIAPEARSVNDEGGSVQVLVTSTGDWTMTGKETYDWVTSNKSEGADGDVVTFTVNPNEGETRLTAEFEFVCGTAKETFMLYSLPSDETLTLTSDAAVTVDYNKGRIEVLVNSSLGYRGVSFTLSEGADWLAHVATLEGDTENDAKMVFDFAALEGLEDREAVITISGDKANPVSVNVLQEAKHVLILDKTVYGVELAGEQILVPVTTNIAYDFEISYTNGYGWISASEKTEEGISLTVDALAEGKRSAIVVLTQTDAKEGEEALTAEFTVTQIEALIKWAANMKGNRLFPKWEGGGPGELSQFTFETLVKFDELREKGIHTIMGIEGMFLLRMGDSLPTDYLQIATSRGNFDVGHQFVTKQWYHIAVVANIEVTAQDPYDPEGGTYPDWFWWSYDYGVKVYVDGVLVHDDVMQTYRQLGNTNKGVVNVSPEWSYEPTGNRCFWVGYSYESSRDTWGQMTEIRIWNKALTAEEINAENHFYTVDPQSEGLYSYWKFTSGEGDTIEDATGRGNPLHGELGVAKQSNGDNKGETGIEWVEVALPEK